MKSESDGINTACTPLRTPFIDNGTMTRLNVSHFVAPRSRLAAMSEPGNSSIELKIGKIINGNSIYAATVKKLKSVNRNSCGAHPNNERKLFTVPVWLKIPINA